MRFLKVLLPLLLMCACVHARQTNTFIPSGGVVTHTTSYTATAADVGKTLNMNCVGCTLSLPAAPPFPQWTIAVKNIASAVLSVNPNGIALDGTLSIISLTQGQWMYVTTDGFTYNSLVSGAASSGGGGPPPGPSAAISPASLSFGTVQTSSNSQSQLVSIANTSSSTAVTVTSSVLTGSGDFQSPNVNACNGVLAAGGNCILSVFLNPSGIGLKTGTLTVNTDVQAPVAIALTGTGSAATTYPLSVTSTDTGSGTIKSADGMINCVIAPPAFPSGACGPVNYASGTGVTLTATASVGSTLNSMNGAGCSVSPCSLTISSPGFTVTADLSSNAPVNVASVAIAPQSINFGTLQNNTPSQPLNIAISNGSTTLPLTVNSVVISDTHFASSNIHICDGILAAGATCIVPIVFTPTSGIAFSGTATVNTNAPSNANSSPVVTLTGSGTPTPTFALSVNGGTSTGGGIVTSNDGLINCTINPPAAPSGVCSNNYVAGATPILTATATSPSTFSTFSGGGCSSSPCTVTIAAATTVSATFTAPIPTFVLTIAGVGQGVGTVTSNTGGINCTSSSGFLSGTCNATYNQGTVVTLTETPGTTGTGTCVGANCTFTSWGGISGCSTATTCIVTMNGNTTASASFAAPAGGAPLQLIQTIPGGTAGTNNVTGNYAAAQTVGNTNIVYIVYNDATTTVSSVTDTKGNTYTQSACSPKVATYTVALYWAPITTGAAAGANTVTAALSASAVGRAIYGFEYSGLTATPVDGCASGSGSGTALNSGNITTTVAGDLLTGADIVGNHITVVSPSWTQQISANGNDAEDRQGVAIGTYNNAPTQSGSTTWVDIAAAWKASGTGGGTTFTLNIAGAGNGSGTVTASGINCTITAGVTSGTCSVTVPINSVLTLVATPTSGAFTSYSGAGCATSPTCVTSAITTNTQVTATFTLAGAQNYFVNSSTGNDSNSGLCAVAGTPSGCTGPWLTINHADAALTVGASGTCTPTGTGWPAGFSVPNAGTCVHVNGSFSGSITTNKSGGPTTRVVFISDTYQSAQLSCPSWAVGGSYSEIDGFNATGPATGCFAFNVSPGSIAHHINIQYNYLHDFTTSGCAQVGIINGGFHDDIYNANIIRHAGNYSADVNHCTTLHGIYSSGVAPTGNGQRDIYENNVISGITGWGIKKQCVQVPFIDGCSGAIVNNTIFNNGGGVNLTQCNDTTCGVIDYVTITNNVIVNNGVDTPAADRWGLHYYHVTGTHIFASNNLIYGNLPADFAHHAQTCGTSASGTSPAVGIPILTTSGDANGNAGGCPEVNGQTDSGGTTATFTAFGVDTPTAPNGSYNAQNYILKSTSHAVNNGTTSCAVSPGLNPCVPLLDFNGFTRPQGAAFDLGAFEFH